MTQKLLSHRTIEGH